MLRQIKAMDYTLPDDATRSGRVRESIYRERASLTTRDETTGETIGAEKMDVALLVLYGHILYSGNSFFPALNYLFRAYALDGENPAVLLSIGLCYIHHSLKRQSENRHYLIMQGLSFMHEYRRVRERKGSLVQERQEMEFNFARVWHMLGLAHLAIEGYQRVLKLGEEIQLQLELARQRQREEKQGQIKVVLTTENDGDVLMEGLKETMTTAPVQQQQQRDTFVEDFSREAAMALQNIYALNGDLVAAKAVTEKWLVI